jgi:hypothetical protein
MGRAQVEVLKECGKGFHGLWWWLKKLGLIGIEFAGDSLGDPLAGGWVDSAHQLHAPGGVAPEFLFAVSAGFASDHARPRGVFHCLHEIQGLEFFAPSCQRLEGMAQLLTRWGRQLVHG